LPAKQGDHLAIQMALVSHIAEVAFRWTTVSASEAVNFSIADKG